ncbi:hypothetical protein [Phenylobacterium sp.]|uniref:hypothetical protein n=1 Tax=Phenylobacterium sp. TaxID=1871053 RepID=UPI0027235E54|nr:hypothetical protein [Phenylobacterium sp.]MDO8378216.1 hypothetical protein [Phenylobacterium sp.]
MEMALAHGETRHAPLGASIGGGRTCAVLLGQQVEKLGPDPESAGPEGHGEKRDEGEACDRACGSGRSSRHARDDGVTLHVSSQNSSSFPPVERREHYEADMNLGA